MKSKTVILITGPTASGKTSLAVKLAKFFNTSIISADSRQCYREMNIGVAKPSSGELLAIKHYFINSHSVHDEVNAATFASYAELAVSEIFQFNDVAIMCGGTGLYIRAFEKGLDEIPGIPYEIRRNILDAYTQKGMSWLNEQVRLHDPEYYGKGEIMNPQRMMRALEVKLATGRSIREYQLGNKPISDRGYQIRKFAIAVPRDELYENINKRVDQMMEDGLEEEARSLYPLRELNALQTVGYSELFDYFEGKYSLDEAVEKIKQHTRNYAKRQLTWLRKDKEITWVKNFEEIIIER